MGIWKSVCFDDREGPPDGRVGDVGRCRLASTASEEATVAAKAVGDDGLGISTIGEGPRVVGEYGPFHRCLGSLVEKVHSDVREDSRRSSDDDASREAVLYEVQASFTIVVDHIRMAH